MINSSNKPFIIGTRGSLLAVTQCTQVKEQLEAISGKSFQLKIITTQGDQITDRPLWQLEGKDFFTKELDAALISGEVDLVVHSYKDLGSERPAEIQLAAIAERRFPHDILLIKESTVAKLSERKISELLVGTSSPRRIHNIEAQLSHYIPNGKSVKISTKTLRGNVNTRIEKLRRDDFDAIVLAFAGLERLAQSEKSALILKELIKGLNFMVLPLSTFPSAAAQGALAVEIAQSSPRTVELQEILAKIHHEDTARAVGRERQAFVAYGGGCHLAVGINVLKGDGFYLHIHKGHLKDQVIDEVRLEGAFPSLPKQARIFLGFPSAVLPKGNFVGDDYLIKKEVLDHRAGDYPILYITSKYGLRTLNSLGQAPKLLAAGTKTWKRLADQGYWVNASSDSLGDEGLNHLVSAQLLSLFWGERPKVGVLTNAQSTSELGEVLTSYEKEFAILSPRQIQEVLNCNVFYWTSFDQYKSYAEAFPQIIDRHHVCGLGKTLKTFIKQKIAITPLARMEDLFHYSEESK